MDESDVWQITVPMLVTSRTMSDPIIGYNAIKELVTHPNDYPQRQHGLKSAFPVKSPGTLAEVIAVLKTETADDLGALGKVKLGKGMYMIPSGETVMLPCRTHVRATNEMSALLEPTVNLAWPEGLVVTEHVDPCTGRIFLSDNGSHY